MAAGADLGASCSTTRLRNLYFDKEMGAFNALARWCQEVGLRPDLASIPTMKSLRQISMGIRGLTIDGERSEEPGPYAVPPYVQLFRVRIGVGV